MSDDVPASPPDSSKTNKVFYGNLLAVLALGVVATGWVLRYTDWFPVVGGLLALGGLFSWLAFIARVIHEDRLKAMQEDALELFDSARALHWTARAGVVVLLLTSFLGTVEVSSVHGSTDRSVTVGGDVLPAAGDRLSPGGRVRDVVWTTFWSPRRLIVKTSGLPDCEVSVRPFCVERLHVPSSFRRPVLFVRPTAGLIKVARSNPLTLVAVVEGTEVARRPFTGDAIWIGCRSDVEVPGYVNESWRAELAASGDLALLRHWMSPAAIDRTPEGERLVLEANDTVSIRLLNPNGSEYAAYHPFVVLAAESVFPQVEDIAPPD